MVNTLVICLIFVCNGICFVSSAPPDPHKKIEHMIQFYGYPFEKHLIETEDGYFIEVHRIPGGKNGRVNRTLINKPPVYLLHALTQSSADWIAVGPRISLAFLLADEGFDVWLGNCRGNIYGRSHKTYLETSYGFWNYSWHEIGVYDMPATIDMILGITGRSQVYFVCFSQGCTAALVMGALRPDYNDKIRLAAKMGPVAYLGNMKGLGGQFLPIVTKLLSPILEEVGHFDLTTTALWTVISTLLIKNKLLTPIIFNFIYGLVGPGNAVNNKQALTDDIIFIPGGISTKQALHYGLGVLHPGTFRLYDYGRAQNLRMYKSPIPPEYPLQNVTMPMVIFQGTNDYCANTLDVQLLIKKLPNVLKVYKKPVNHIDFGYNKHMRSLVYNDIVELFKMTELRNVCCL